MEVQLFESIYKPRAGGTTTKAVTRTIANTGLSQTEVLLREAIQNSYDAHLNNNKPLKVNLKCYKFSKDSVEFISNLFKKTGKIGQSLEKNILMSYYNLEISDRNTTGLTGYNGFQERESDVEEKFHHFIYMTGNDDVKDKGSGGSYGFGKAALYKYSDFRTIVVYSRIYSKVSNQYQSRFIICRVDDRLPEKESRCWWGAEGKYSDGTTYAKPINGEEADLLAKKFGLTSFSENETGTDILIMKATVKDGLESFEPTFEEEIPALICHWFWPKIITQNLQKKIDFSLFLNEEDITENIPDPTETYPYSTFSRAFRNCVDYYSHKAGSNNDDVVLVNFERPYVELGGIFLKKVGIRPFMYDKYINTDFSKPQVVLMRDVEFIVKYEEVDVDVSNTHTTCFGLFHTNRLGHRQNGDDSHEVEHYFRDIENQTHNQWTHSDLLPFNYLGKLNKVLPESVKKCLDIKTSIGNTASISGLVAQKFGSKLGFGFIGGASDTVSDDTRKTGETKKKSSFTRKNVPVELSIENNSTILTVSYEAKIENSIPMLIDLTPVIKSSDPKESEIALENEIKIKYLSFTDRSGTNSMTPPKQPGNLFKIIKSGDYKLILESNINCAFDIQMKKVELNG